MSCKANHGYYIPVGHAVDLLEVEQLPRETVLETLRPLLEDPKIGKVGHNIKYDLIVLAHASSWDRPRGIRLPR